MAKLNRVMQFLDKAVFWLDFEKMQHGGCWFTIFLVLTVVAIPILMMAVVFVFAFIGAW